MQDDDIENVTGKLETTPAVDEYGDMIVPELPYVDDEEVDFADKYLNTGLLFDEGTGDERHRRAKGILGEPIGRAHTNPLFDTHEYVVELAGMVLLKTISRM